MSDYVELTRFIVGRIVGGGESVEVVARPRGRTTIVEVSVSGDALGKVIGRGGRHIDAIRAVVRAAGLRNHERVQVELADRRVPG